MSDQPQPEPQPATTSPHLVPVPSAAPRPIPWDDIRRLYIQGVPTGPGLPDQTQLLDELGEGETLEKARRAKIGGLSKVTRVGKNRVVFPALIRVAHYFLVPERVVEQRARDEDWLGLQRIYRAQLHQKHGQLRSQQRLIDVEYIDRRAFAVAKMGLKMVFDRLELMTQTVEVMDGEVTPMADYRELESLSKSASVWHALGRRSLGFPVEAAGINWGLDAAEGNFGLMPVDGDDVLELEEAKSSVSAELAKDDAERLHGFLTVLGRAQNASRSEAESESA